METNNERGVTLQSIIERLAELKKQRERAFAQYNALHGAIQECEYWLSVLADQKGNCPEEVSTDG